MKKAILILLGAEVPDPSAPNNPYVYPNNYYNFDSCWIGDELFANRGVFGW